MSLARVRAGATDPREVKKLLARGVSVFSRGSLHAKFFIIDKVVIAGSSNISSHAKNSLDEAAVLTDDSAAVLRARTTFEKLCTEPVRKDYLAKCIKEYRPPKFTGHSTAGTKKGKKIVRSKLWIIGGLRYISIPKDEESSVQAVVNKATKKLLDFEKSEVDYCHYPAKEAFFSSLREGDWVLRCLLDGKGYDVWAPGRFLGVENYPRDRGKHRYLLLFEDPLEAEAIRWTAFRALAPMKLPAVPRRLAVQDDADADAILRLWDSRGRFKKSKRL